MIFAHASSPVAFSPDGRRLASGSRDENVLLWDVESCAEFQDLRRVLRGHRDIVRNVVFSPDGRHLASGSRDENVLLWDVESGALLRALRVGAMVNSISFSPDGGRLASGSHDNAVRLWDVESSAEPKVLRGHQAIVYCVAFSPDGQRLASGSGDNTVRLWDVESSAELKVLRGHRATVYSVAFSPDGQRLASGSGDNTVRLWDTKSGATFFEELPELVRCMLFWLRLHRVLRGHQKSVNSVAFSPDGRHLVSGSDDNTVRLWGIESGAELQILRMPNCVASVAFSPDGRRVASAAGNTVHLWDLTGVEAKSLRLTPTLRSVGKPSVTELWIQHGHKDRKTSEGTTSLPCVAFSHDGRCLAIASNHFPPAGVQGDYAVRLWDVESGAELRKFCLVPVDPNEWNKVTGVAFSPYKRILAAGCSSGTVHLWDLENGTETRVLQGHGSVGCITFSPDGRFIASGWSRLAGPSGGFVCGVELLNLADDVSRVYKFDGYGTVAGLAFSSDGQCLAYHYHHGRTLGVLSVGSGTVKILAGHEGSVMSVACSPGGVLASGSDDKAVRLWDIKTGAEIRALLHEGEVTGLAFFGDCLVSGSSDGTVRLWDTRTGTQSLYVQIRGGVSSLAISSDGRLAITVGEQVRLWDLSAHLGVT